MKRMQLGRMNECICPYLDHPRTLRSFFIRKTGGGDDDLSTISVNAYVFAVRCSSELGSCAILLFRYQGPCACDGSTAALFVCASFAITEMRSIFMHINETVD